MNNVKKVTKTDQKYIVLMHDGGLSFAVIGKILGFSADAAAKHYQLEKHGRSNKREENAVDWSKVKTGLGNIPRGGDSNV